MLWIKIRSIDSKDWILGPAILEGYSRQKQGNWYATVWLPVLSY